MNTNVTNQANHTQHNQAKPNQITPCQTKHITIPGDTVLLCTTPYHTTLPKLVYADQKSNHMVVVWWCGGCGGCGGVVVWFILPIIEPPQSKLLNSGLNWVVAILRALLRHV